MKNETDKNTEKTFGFKANTVLLKNLVLNPFNAVSTSMKNPRIVFLLTFFVLVTLLLTTILLPSIIGDSQDMLQTTSLAEHLSPEEYSAFTRLSPIHRAFASTLITFFTLFAVIIQAFILYLIFALARYPGLYKEYFSAALIISFYDTVLPMILTFFLPARLLSSLNLASLFPNVSALFLAFLQPLDLFTIGSLLIMAKGISLYAEKRFTKTTIIIFNYLIVKTLFFGSINLFFS